MTDRAYCPECRIVTEHPLSPDRRWRSCRGCQAVVRADQFDSMSRVRVMRMDPGPTSRDALMQCLKAFAVVNGDEADEMHLTKPQFDEMRRDWLRTDGGLPLHNPPDGSPAFTLFGIRTYVNARIFILALGCDGPEVPPELEELERPLTRRSHEPQIGVSERAIDL